MGFHQGLTGELYDRQYSNKILLSRIWDYAKRHRKFIFWMTFSIILHGLFAALPPLLISKVLDEGIAGIPNEMAYTVLVAGVIFLQVMDFVFYYVIRRLMSRITANMNRDLSIDAFASSIEQDLAFHDRL